MYSSVTPMEIYHEWIRMYRDVPVETLADYMRVSPVTIRRWLSGSNKPTLRNVDVMYQMVNDRSGVGIFNADQPRLPLF